MYRSRKKACALGIFVREICRGQILCFTGFLHYVAVHTIFKIHHYVYNMFRILLRIYVLVYGMCVEHIQQKTLSMESRSKQQLL